MAPALVLSFSALCGGLLLVLAAVLRRLFPRSPAARWWMLSWVSAASGLILRSLAPLLDASPWAPGGPTVVAFFLQAALVLYTLGVRAWVAEDPGRKTGGWLGAALTLGAAVAVALSSPGLAGRDVAAGVFAAGWAGVPVAVAAFLLATRGLGSPSAPVRTQTRSLLLALLGGPISFVVAWIVLPESIPLFLVSGAALTLRSLHHFDARFHPGRAAPFVAEKTQDTVLFLRADGAVQASNPALKSLLEYDEDGLNGRKLGTLAADEDARHLLASLEDLTFPDWEGTMNLASKAGRPVPVHVVFRRLHNPAREAVGAVLLLYDLRLPRRLDLSGREDLLTSLSNRRWVLELLEAEFQRVKRYGGPLAALWIVVTDLAAIEARFGAEASDDVLRRLGSILRGGLRRTDFCGRVGHRDFLAVLPETADDRAERVAHRLEKMFVLSEEGEVTGASLRIGWASLGEESATSEAFLARLQDAVPAGSS